MLNLVEKVKHDYYMRELHCSTKGARFYLYSFASDGSPLYFKSFASKGYAMRYLDKYVADLEDRLNDMRVRHGMRPASLDGRRFRLECTFRYNDPYLYYETYEWKRG